jgi:uncharacterized protein (DUF1501 family)
MNPNYFIGLNRRAFFDRSIKIGMGVALATLTDIPFVMKRALAEGTIGVNGKKVLFVFLRGANDALNSVIPIQDSGYNTDTYTSNGVTRTARPNIAIPKDGLLDYSAVGGCDVPVNPLYGYTNAIRLGNGFTALHPSLKYLAPVYNAGDLALIHRVGYPKQSRSHFDSQNYWESGRPGDNVAQDGIFYRAMVESGLSTTRPLTGVSIQSALPLLLRGSEVAMTNLSDPLRYNLLGIPNTVSGNSKTDQYLGIGNGSPFAPKLSRDLLNLQYKNLSDTLQVFSGIGFDDAANTFIDPDTGYYLFPATDAKNAGQVDVSSNSRSFFTNLKAAALVLNKTDAIVAGTEMGGFDTHISQGAATSAGTGNHEKLLRRIGWAMYGLRKYFLANGDKVSWNNLIVVTLSEFGRTSKQNGSTGTDHAEAGVMFVAGGGVKGFGKNGRTSGVFNCHGSVDPILNPIVWNTGLSGSMFAISSNYLRRTTDYRSVLGRILRKHLGAQFDENNPYAASQLGRIIPGYLNSAERLFMAGTNTLDSTATTGELDFI